MKKPVFLFAIALMAAVTAAAQDLTSKFDSAKLRERVIKLSSDDFEGRGPGTAGGTKAAQYIADQMKASGVKPGNMNSYFQNVKLVGVKADPNTKLQITGKDGTTSFNFADDFVATTGAQAANVSVDSEIVFMGYGIDAPLFKWNDYSGSPNDYKGKILMIMVNDPQATAAEPDLFGGKGLTYFGRWTYKFEEAARRGAAGVILIHTTESAGYGWNVVRTSNGNWRYEIARTAGEKTPFLNIKSWTTFEAAKKILASAGHNIDELMASARQRGFKPVNTGLRAKLDLKSELKSFDSPNVVGTVEGSDPRLKNEYVIYSAHWDHLGIGNPDADGDKIYNGAYDNASGVAAVLGIADVLAKMPQKERPKRSFMFFFPTAEEQGLLGAEYYAQNPLVPLAKTAANVNLDGVNFFGKASDVMPLGAERSSIMDQIAEAAKERSIEITPDAEPEQGYFFRSDHFPFAKVGVPSVNFQHGEKFDPPLTGEALAFSKDYTSKYYHQASDEYQPWWNMESMIQEAELALSIGIKLANVNQLPRYKETDEFSAPDKKRFGK
jgi:Zn-dependent M28 family amino/carboxypeptidase